MARENIERKVKEEARKIYKEDKIRWLSGKGYAKWYATFFRRYQFSLSEKNIDEDRICEVVKEDYVNWFEEQIAECMSNEKDVVCVTAFVEGKEYIKMLMQLGSCAAIGGGVFEFRKYFESEDLAKTFLIERVKDYMDEGEELDKEITNIKKGLFAHINSIKFLIRKVNYHF